jgi:hypothetical protein
MTNPYGKKRLPQVAVGEQHGQDRGDAAQESVAAPAGANREPEQMTDDNDFIIAHGGAEPIDLHLLADVVAVDGEIIDYLKPTLLS